MQSDGFSELKDKFIGAEREPDKPVKQKQRRHRAPMMMSRTDNNRGADMMSIKDGVRTQELSEICQQHIIWMFVCVC